MALVIQFMMALRAKRRREKELLGLQEEIEEHKKQIRRLERENEKLKNLVLVFLTEYEKRDN
jgi:hypothetical protein